MNAAAQSAFPFLSPAFHDKLIALLGPDHVRPATPADAFSGLQPHLLLEPATEQQLAEVLHFANESKLAVIPRGGGTKLPSGNPPSHFHLILSTAPLNRILDHAWSDLTVIVEAGCSLQTLQQTLAHH